MVQDIEKLFILNCLDNDWYHSWLFELFWNNWNKNNFYCTKKVFFFILTFFYIFLFSYFLKENKSRRKTFQLTSNYFDTLFFHFRYRFNLSFSCSIFLNLEPCSTINIPVSAIQFSATSFLDCHKSKFFASCLIFLSFFEWTYKKTFSIKHQIHTEIILWTEYLLSVPLPSWVPIANFFSNYFQWEFQSEIDENFFVIFLMQKNVFTLMAQLTSRWEKNCGIVLFIEFSFWINVDLKIPFHFLNIL